ncbi:hypothetical protein BOX15_Mlig021061g1 [Macrostomum lignano]|uniref:Uncharacterized protein n=1 Tax=Macrostomum lignano TaxID=282301 RepID=A0A267GZQ4_9PLAT|nr:hypothetical protein BOX15_Mlig021061g1 [Macrostomum lignano]
MAPILEPLVDSSVLYDSPGLAILLATSGAALLACIAGGLAFYAFSLVDAKADSVSNIEDVEKRRRNTTVWNNTNSTLREEASKKCAGLDPAAAARAIEELCGLGEVGSKATSEKQLKRYNEQLCHRLRRQFTSRVQPSQWNLPAILELAEAASFAATAADEHGDDQLSGRSRKASLLVRQPGRLRFANCGEKSAKMFVAQRAGVAKSCHRANQFCLIFTDKQAMQSLLRPAHMKAFNSTNVAAPTGNTCQSDVHKFASADCSR